MVAAELSGVSIVGGVAVKAARQVFRGINPADGDELETEFFPATEGDIERAAKLATEAAPVLARLSGAQKAKLLRTIAEELSAEAEALVARAHLETGLPLPRLQGELGRTTGQLKLFADVVEEGSWVDARIDNALPERKPLPRADIRSMLRPVGPVAVFGASNFPLAFSVAGGDTASALAAGCPVIVKAHPAHPGASEIAARAVVRAVEACGLPAGVFALLFDAGVDVGVALVQQPAVKAVGFTGSAGGGKALMQLCAARPEPIPCFAEMGSTNPLFILPGAMRERGKQLAAGLQGSFTLGSGQFCTKPGVVFVPNAEAGEFLDNLRSGVELLGGQGMLTPGIAARYIAGVSERAQSEQAERFAGKQAQGLDGGGALVSPIVFAAPMQEFLDSEGLEEEIFGPTTLLVHYGASDDLLAAARKLHGHLTATVHGTDEDLEGAGELIEVLSEKVGRVLFNGYPTGVEVCSAMVHGGPFPATSDGRLTSVGTRAMLRFARPVCYQDCPDAALPVELRRGNPAGLLRMVDGVVGRE